MAYECTKAKPVTMFEGGVLVGLGFIVALLTKIAQILDEIRRK